MILKYQTKIYQKLFLLGIILILLGLFLPWYTVGDLVSVNIQPLVISWWTIFTEAGGRLYLPSLRQYVSTGFVSLLGAICLIVLGFARNSSQIIKWITIGVSVFILSISIYHLILIWKIFLFDQIIGFNPPGIGLYVCLLGSVIVFYVSLGIESKKSS